MLSLTKTRVFMLAVGLFLSIASVSRAQETDKVFMPIGGGYADTFDGFIAAAVAHTSGNVVNILVLPPAYSTSADAITEEERATNISDAEERRQLIFERHAFRGKVDMRREDHFAVDDILACLFL